VSDLAVVSIPNGRFAENCFLLADAEAGVAVMVDPGEEPERFLAELAGRSWRLQAIWLTHGHLDHIMGVEAVKAATGVPVLLHPLDRPLYDGLSAQGQWAGLRLTAPPPPDVPLTDGRELVVGRHRFTVRHSPGHSPGSVAFVGDGCVIGGDALFNGSIGRTDLPGGDFATLLASLQRVFMSLPDSTVVYCGHGPETTVGVERMTNPFLAGAYRG
jgi:hydroxyacylglutathione hydrolase